MTYIRSYAAGWAYTELDAAGDPVRHIEMRGSSYVAAAARAEVSAARAFGGDEAVEEYESRYGVIPRKPIAALSEMTAETFAELWRLARCRLDGVAEVQIHEVRPRTPAGLPVVVRCVGGLVRVGSRLVRARDPREQVRLTVARILRYDRDVAELEPSHTAILILSGDAGTAVRPGQHLTGHTV